MVGKFDLRECGDREGKVAEDAGEEDGDRQEGGGDWAGYEGAEMLMDWCGGTPPPSPPARERGEVSVSGTYVEPWLRWPRRLGLGLSLALAAGWRLGAWRW